jgi:hypothetical protein
MEVDAVHRLDADLLAVSGVATRERLRTRDPSDVGEKVVLAAASCRLEGATDAVHEMLGRHRLAVSPLALGSERDRVHLAVR